MNNQEFDYKGALTFAIILLLGLGVSLVVAITYLNEHNPKLERSTPKYHNPIAIQAQSLLFERR